MRSPGIRWSVRLDGELRLFYAGKAYDLRGSGDSVAIGSCSVVDNRIRFRMLARSEVAIESFGFVPVSKIGEADHNDSQLERLRSLGYLSGG